MRHQPVHLLALAAFTALGPIAVLVFVGDEKVYLDGWVHVVCVAIGAACPGGYGCRRSQHG